MIIENFDTSKKIFVIAEIGNNHEGNFKIAKDMISAAADTGANAVKFQTIVPELFVSKFNVERFKKLKSFQLKYSQFEKLALHAQKKNIFFCSTPFDLKSAIFLNQIQSFFKISSGDNDFYPLISQICKFNKPIIISTGLVTLNKIKKIVNFIIREKKTKFKNSELGILHCISSYPTPLNETNLKSVTFLKKKFSDLSIGYSDHTLGNMAAYLSVACGAEIIEKHFTLDKNFSSFIDHKLSADPGDMKQLIDKIRKLEKILGTEQKSVQKSEELSVIEYKRSIASNKNLRKGYRIKKSDLMWIRPGRGFQPGKEKKIINRKINKKINMGHIFKEDDFEK